MPVSAPNPKMAMMGKLPLMSPLVNPDMTLMMYSYFPRISKMKLPDMPGSIMAHIAMAPLRKMNQRSSGVSVGESVHTTTPRKMPKTTISNESGVHLFISLRMKMEDATIRPKKNPQVSMGC